MAGAGKTKQSEKPPAERVAFGGRLRLLIGDRPIAQVARGAGILPQHLHGVMAGERPIPADQLVALLRFCGATPEAVFPPKVEVGSLARLSRLTTDLWLSASGQPVTKAGNQDLPAPRSDPSITFTPSLWSYLEKHGDDVTFNEAKRVSRLSFKLDDETPELDPETFWDGIFATIRKSRKGS